MTEQEKKYAVWGLVVAIVSAVIAFLQFVVPMMGGAGDPAARPDDRAAITRHRPDEPLRRLFTADTIGATLEYFETIAGPAKKESGFGGRADRTYDINGCQLAVYIDTFDVIESITLAITPFCTFDWSDADVAYGELPGPTSLHFRDVMTRQIPWTFETTCLGNCGVDYTVHGLRFNSANPTKHVDIVLGAGLKNEHNFSLNSKLTTRLQEARGEEFVAGRQFQCGFDLNGAVKGIAEDFTVDFVMFRRRDDLARPAPGAIPVCPYSVSETMPLPW